MGWYDILGLFLNFYSMGHCWMHVYDLDRDRNALYTCDYIGCDFRCKTEQVMRKHVTGKKHDGFTDHRLRLVKVYRKIWPQCFPNTDEQRILLKYSHAYNCLFNESTQCDVTISKCIYSHAHMMKINHR